MVSARISPFKGRRCFGQYVPSKRTRFGIKAWILTEFEKGYVIKYSSHKANPLATQRIQILLGLR